MKYNELKNSNKKQLVEQSKELRSELFQLKLKNKTSQLDKKSNIQSVRRDIARLQTRLSEIARSGEKI